jgi:hypothetical protein
MAVPPIMPGIWNWPEPLAEEPPAGRPDYAGYKVVANDGEIGHVVSYATAQDTSHLVVDTSSWLFGRLSVIPASRVRVVNDESETVQIDLTKQEIKDAPEYDRSQGYEHYRDEGSEYYGRLSER